MILLKIGGSLIAKKNTEDEIAISYLQDIYTFLSSYDNETIVLVHGTGNVGHGFVKKYGLSKENMHVLRKELDIYFTKIDDIFAGFTRVYIGDIITGKYKISQGSKILCGGDITREAEIISSDDAFSYILNHENANIAYILTDVDGVFDKENNIIKEIRKDSYKNIYFRKKEGDVTGSMEQKIQKLFEYSVNTDKKVWIINGKNTKNFKNILSLGKGIGTQVYI